MSTERHSTESAHRVKLTVPGVPPGWVIPFNEVPRRMGLGKKTVAAWKRQGLEQYIHREGRKEFIFTDDLLEFLRKRWQKQE